MLYIYIYIYIYNVCIIYVLYTRTHTRTHTHTHKHSLSLSISLSLSRTHIHIYTHTYIVCICTMYVQCVYTYVYNKERQGGRCFFFDSVGAPFVCVSMYQCLSDHVCLCVYLRVHNLRGIAQFFFVLWGWTLLRPTWKTVCAHTVSQTTLEAGMKASMQQPKP